MRKIWIAVLILVSFLVLNSVSVTANSNTTSESVVYRFERNYIISNDSSTDAQNVQIRLFLIDNREDWASQHILSEEVKVNGSLISSLPPGNEDNRPMEFKLGRINAGNSKTINIVQLLKINTTNFEIVPSQTDAEIPSKYQKYTKPVTYLWQSDHPKIQNKAMELTSGENDYYSKAVRILEWVENHLDYSVQSVEHSASWAYNSKVGDCSEYSNLFIALCRSAGIPAKAVSGYLPFTGLYDSKSSTTADFTKTGHQWVIIYLPSVGWIPVDLTYNIPQGEFGRLSNDHIVELTGDGDDWVEDSQISIPSTSWTWEYNSNEPSPDLSLSTSGTIDRVVDVETEILADEEIEDGSWKFTVKIRNVGSMQIKDVSVRLEGENTYFGTPPQRIWVI